MPEVSQIFVYPIKSCRGIAVSHAEVQARGLAHDRRYMLVDANGRFLTQRQHGRMALIYVSFGDDGFVVEAPGMRPCFIPERLAPGDSAGSTACEVKVWKDTVEATLADADTNVWFSAYMGFACGLVYLADTQHRPVLHESAGFDDEVSFADGAPLMLLSEASLMDLNERLKNPVTINQFRPNLVVTADAAYAEDTWRHVEIDKARFDVAWPCSRCILTTIDPATGERDPEGEPMNALKRYRFHDRAVFFGQNLLPRATGRIAVGSALSIQ